MKGSWNFFVALVAGFAIALGVTFGAFYLNLGVYTAGSKWAFDINEKKRVLAKQSPSPKLLLVGGSGTLFGLSAHELEKETGLRTVNLGTHAALGTSWILYAAKRVARPGDTVLITLEYELYWSGEVEQTGSDSLLLDYIVARDPEFFWTLSLKEKWNIFMLTPNRRLIKGMKRRSKIEQAFTGIDVYDVSCINEWGDQTKHSGNHTPVWRTNQVEWKASLRYGMPQEPKSFPVLKDFCKWAAANQIRVVATFPNLCDGPEYHTAVAKDTAERIKKFFASLNVPVLGEYTDAILPADQFYDTNYHLTEEAARARTQRLAAKLAPYLKGTKPGGGAFDAAL